MSLGKSNRNGAKFFRKLARRTHNTCVLCGTEFDNVDVINREHMIPRGQTAQGDKHTENVLGAHIVCNNFRGTYSLVGTMRLLGKSAQRDPSAFSRWANSVKRGKCYKYTYPPNVTRDELASLLGDVKRLHNVFSTLNEKD